jgi:hypothetical protein
VCSSDLAHGAGGGVTRVVPPGEGGDEDRLLQRRSTVPPDVVHEPMLRA